MTKKIEQVEPNAGMRELASAMVQMYKALIDEGLSEGQALFMTANAFRPTSNS